MTSIEKNPVLLWPATNVNEENGKLFSPPYKFFSLYAIDLIFGLIGQKGGSKYFVDEGLLYPDVVNRLKSVHGKHNIIDNLGIVDSLDQKSYFAERYAVIHVKSSSGYDVQTYPITYDRVAKRTDDYDDIVRRLSIMNIVHQCKRINFDNARSLDPKLVKKWLKNVRIKDLRIISLCYDIMTGWLHLANNRDAGYALDYFGILDEDKLVEEVGPYFRFMNKAKSLRLRDLNREIPKEIFDDTKLNELINETLFELWIKDTQN